MAIKRIPIVASWVAMSAMVLAALLASSRATARPSLAPDQVKGLVDRWEVLSFSDPVGDGIVQGKAIGYFHVPAEQVFRVVTDYQHYPEFAPRISSVQVVDRQGDRRAFVRLQTDLPWPVSDAWVYAQFEHEQLADGGYRIRFWQIKGSMKRYYGTILIEPWVQYDDGGGECSVTYELVAEPATSLAPKRYINHKIVDATSKWVHALRLHINQLRAAGRLHPTLRAAPDLVPLGGARRPVRTEDVAHAK
ncbi:MAG TPA: SRPBCC family protein [Polyangia bacterium]|nr:SRPBCC family protein [Polyangia bacterium]